MVERLCFTDEMLNDLSSLKGKTLKCYEADLGGVDGNIAYTAVVLQTDSERVMISRFEVPMTLFGADEEEAPFKCFKFGLNEFYDYNGKENAKRYLVNERIVAIELVRDSATWVEGNLNNTLIEDAGIVIRTPGHELGLFRDSFECIAVNLVDLPSAGRVVVGREKYWGEDDDGFHLKREVIEL